MQKTKSLLFLFPLIFLIACKTTNLPSTDFSNFNATWENEVPEILWTFDYTDKIQPLIVHGIKINLKNPNLSAMVFPYNEFQVENHEVKTAEQFAREENLNLTFNTTPYSAKGIAKNRDKTISGITISTSENNTFILTQPVSRYSALYLFRNENGGYKAEIVSSQTIPEKLPDFGSGGFFQILKDGEILSFIYRKDTRLAAGLHPDGSLILLIAEGEKKSKSTGLSYGECASILKALGCTDALQFDGGGSTQVYLNGKNVLIYGKKRKVPALSGFKF